MYFASSFWWKRITLDGAGSYPWWEEADNFFFFFLDLFTEKLLLICEPRGLYDPFCSSHTNIINSYVVSFY